MESAERQTLEDMGYDPFFESERDRLGLGGFPVARVITESKGAYGVRGALGEYRATVTGKRMFTASSREDYPAVGDWVAIDELDGGHAVIRDILPRKTVIKRRSGDRNRAGEKSDVQVIAANVDVAFVVESVDRDYSLNRFERYFAIAEGAGVKAAIVLNKTDLLTADELASRLRELAERFPGTGTIATSTVTSDGLDKLKGYLERGRTYCFLGSSGVGKSSLVNELIGKNAIRTGEISEYSDRGKHTTTSRHMYFLEGGGIVIDNPGMREIGAADAGAGVDAVFDEIAALSQGCKFADCTHIHEPGCEVIRAVEAGDLDREKYSNYIGLKKEAEYLQSSDVEKREEDRKFGKMMKNYKKQSRRSEY